MLAAPPCCVTAATGASRAQTSAPGPSREWQPNVPWPATSRSRASPGIFTRTMPWHRTNKFPAESVPLRAMASARHRRSVRPGAKRHSTVAERTRRGTCSCGCHGMVRVNIPRCPRARWCRPGNIRLPFPRWPGAWLRRDAPVAAVTQHGGACEHGREPGRQSRGDCDRRRCHADGHSDRSRNRPIPQPIRTRCSACSRASVPGSMPTRSPNGVEGKGANAAQFLDGAKVHRNRCFL